MTSDPTQLQQLLGINMAIVLIAVFNILGSIALSFYFGWKLTLLTICTTMPIILYSGYHRIQYEVQFESTNHVVFAESSKFATEAIGAIRTVSSLTLEGTICRRFEALLENHAKLALKKAKWSCFVFSLSDSISILCMAFILWYGYLSSGLVYSELKGANLFLGMVGASCRVTSTPHLIIVGSVHLFQRKYCHSNGSCSGRISRSRPRKYQRWAVIELWSQSVNSSPSSHTWIRHFADTIFTLRYGRGFGSSKPDSKYASSSSN